LTGVNELVFYAVAYKGGAWTPAARVPSAIKLS
jgi:hypothetical protein